MTISHGTHRRPRAGAGWFVLTGFLVFTACGGSASETPPPLEPLPDPARNEESEKDESIQPVPKEDQDLDGGRESGADGPSSDDRRSGAP